MFEFLIDTLNGEPLLADLENIGACYPDDDVIYVYSIPCRLSSARNVPAEQSVESTASQIRVPYGGGNSANYVFVNNRLTRNQ